MRLCVCVYWIHELFYPHLPTYLFFIMSENVYASHCFRSFYKIYLIILFLCCCGFPSRTNFSSWACVRKSKLLLSGKSRLSFAPPLRNLKNKACREIKDSDAICLTTLSRFALESFMFGIAESVEDENKSLILHLAGGNIVVNRRQQKRLHLCVALNKI